MDGAAPLDPLRQRVEALARAGELAGAIGACERILATAPEDPWALLAVGTLLGSTGRLPEARAALERAATLGALGAASNLGGVLLALGEPAAAAAALERAVADLPEDAAAWFNLGVAEQALGRPGAALARLLRALALRPDDARALHAMGGVRMALGHGAEAEAALRAAARAAPAWHAPWHDLGQLGLSRGDPATAVAAFDEAILRAPGHAPSHLDRAVALLQLGAWAEGWRAFEWRWGLGGRTPGLSPRGPDGVDAPVWEGAPLDGRELLVWAEQGLGDTLQFVRYAARVRAAGGRVAVRAPGPLARLLQACDAVDRVVSEGEPGGAPDVQAPMLSLPRLFGTTPDTVPADVPYLRAPRADREAVAALPWAPGLRVGVVWRSGPHYRHHARRDCPPALLARLGAVPGVRLHALQWAATPEEVAALGPCVDLGPALGDFARTAALIERVDLVVTVDTATAHLAGGLGVPVWTLLSSVADWRWGLGREDSPWYPTMRLFRQDAAGGWEGVLDRVAAALMERIRR